MKKISEEKLIQLLRNEAELRLLEAGGVEPFVRILGNCIDPTRIMRNTMDPPMNSIQMRIDKMMCEENNTTLHKALNDKRLW
jgi:hypothetical protein